MSLASRANKRLRRTDTDWAQLGDNSPYLGVLGDEASEAAADDVEMAERFFATGERYVARIRDLIHSDINPSFVPTRALDFGCGVGRVTLPLARWASFTVGVDTSNESFAALSRGRRTRLRAASDLPVPMIFCLFARPPLTSYIPTSSSNTSRLAEGSGSPAS